MEIPENFCVVPWTGINGRSNGYMAPCCNSTSFYQSESGEYLRLQEHRFSDGFRSVTAERLRKNLLAGIQDPGCGICWRAEARGQKSLRQFENEAFAFEAKAVVEGRYETTQPISIDISPGNACNLKCRICGPYASSSWEKEVRELGIVEPLHATRGNWAVQNKGNWDELESWLPLTRKFNFTGGEPFLSVQHLALITKAVEGGYSRNQRLCYNSNGTIFKSSFSDLFSGFKHVQLWLSLDDLGERFEYQRHGANWAEVLANLEKFQRLASVELAICVTVSALNVFYLLEILDFWLARNTKVFLGEMQGKPFELQCLPRSVRRALLEKFEKTDFSRYDAILINHLAPFLELLRAEVPEQFEVEHLEALRASLRRHDEYRGESYARTFPEAARLFGI